MIKTIVGLENPSYAVSGLSVPDRTAAATASSDAVRIGSAPIMTDRIVAAKIANRCHACAVRVPGGGVNQIPRATASVTTLVIRWRRRLGVVTGRPRLCYSRT